MNAETQPRFDLAAEAVPGPVALGFLPQTARFSLRIDPGELAAASRAAGLSLPGRIGEAAQEGTRRALCLGPDEWALWAEEAEARAIEEGFAANYAETPHSLVATGDREVAVSLEGAEALTLLSVGCPTDLAGLAVGQGKRTVFDGVQVVLYREAQERYMLEVWRSFLPHVWALLNTGNRELALGL